MVARHRRRGEHRQRMAGKRSLNDRSSRRQSEPRLLEPSRLEPNSLRKGKLQLCIGPAHPMSPFKRSHPPTAARNATRCGRAGAPAGHQVGSPSLWQQLDAALDRQPGMREAVTPARRHTPARMGPAQILRPSTPQHLRARCTKSSHYSEVAAVGARACMHVPWTHTNLLYPTKYKGLGTPRECWSADLRGSRRRSNESGASTPAVRNTTRTGLWRSAASFSRASMKTHARCMLPLWIVPKAPTATSIAAAFCAHASQSTTCACHHLPAGCANPLAETGPTMYSVAACGLHQDCRNNTPRAAWRSAQTCTKPATSYEEHWPPSPTVGQGRS